MHAIMLFAALFAAAPLKAPAAGVKSPGATTATNKAAAAKFQPTDPLRNPFWPVEFDYEENDLQPITTVPMVDVTARVSEDEERAAATAGAAAAIARTSKTISLKSWSDATKALHFKGKTTVVEVMTGKKRTAFFINGNTYGIGDFISVNHDGHRFTWRIRQRTDMETLMLEQIRAIKLPDEEEPATKKGKSK
ncbi:MAG: hypothetical protein J6T01_01165 [Kiritimatiellae bacterium]|nr:hypothetical protein [Kiritimatiellia bacterium]